MQGLEQARQHHGRVEGLRVLLRCLLYQLPRAGSLAVTARPCQIGIRRFAHGCHIALLRPRNGRPAYGRGNRSCVQRQPLARYVVDQHLGLKQMNFRSRRRKCQQRQLGDPDRGVRRLCDFLVVFIGKADICEPEFEPPSLREPQNRVTRMEAVALNLGIELALQEGHEKGQRNRAGKKPRIQSRDTHEHQDASDRRCTPAEAHRTARRGFHRTGNDAGKARQLNLDGVSLYGAAVLLSHERAVSILTRRTVTHCRSEASASREPLFACQLPP